MVLDLSIVYRGRLSGCNYDCHYCPFAKRVDDKETLMKDASELNQFVNWAEAREGKLKILFTPWGEALIRKPYQDALIRLSHMPHVERVSIQTNLSCKLGWIDALDAKTASLWCTYHPEEVPIQKFLKQCAKLDSANINYSVGIVGIKQAFPDITLLRSQLSASIYLWINAYKDEGEEYYDKDDIAFLKQVDPYFELNLKNYESLGRACRAGDESISVDGEGNARRCHFIPEIIGNIYDGSLDAALRPRLCIRKLCDCHIGYSNIPDLELDKIFAGWALGRIV